ncbi:helix-turn-helix domain-containing protein [Cellulosimicrobium arenosum]|uniref:Helix-turn-helix transcriptional regulator n=1 Tax=Cellulosimicrobium arenosum TaxID=2708133 RepID=A0A927G8G1_9MICO|nr:XRE family transcriptional regulator [Cellulosimicrobium arenosum]MBD8078868.1 helix-turn-helix transcriptional regulator [Cellulosimicrobium arenosum]
MVAPTDDAPAVSDGAVVPADGGAADPLDRSVTRLGQRIRTLRHAHGLTLVQLADATGLSHSFLSQVERGHARLSMSSLFRVATTLGTTQQVLLAEATATTASASPVLRRTEEASASAGGGTVRALAAAGDRPFDPLEYTGTSQDLGEYWLHDEDEFAYVVEGRVLLDLDGTVDLLEPGDSVFYPSGTRHRWASADGGPYRLLAVKQRLVRAVD